MEDPIHALRTPAHGSMLRTPAAGARGGNDSPADSEHTVALSDVWSVFEQALQEAPAAQPVLVLATTHSGCLPLELLRWFDHPRVSHGSAAKSMPDIWQSWRWC